MERQLQVIDYHQLCLDNKLDFEGVHKVTPDSGYGVVISPGIAVYILPVLMYKFRGVPVHNEADGLLALWAKDKGDRDRFYMLCIYLLRSVCLDVW